MNAMTQARTIMNGAFDMAWEKEHASREWHRQRDPRIEQLIDEHFNPTELSRMRALDLGCGSGANAFPLARKGFIVDAVDGSESAIRRCLRFKVDEINTAERINFSLGDVTNLPYSDGIFDLVIDVATLECLEWDDGRRAVAEVYRVMRPGGLFFSFTATSEYDLKQNPHFGTLRRMTKDLTELFYEGFAALEIYHSVHTTQQQKKVPWWIVLARKAMVNADG